MDIKDVLLFIQIKLKIFILKEKYDFFLILQHNCTISTLDNYIIKFKIESDKFIKDYEYQFIQFEPTIQLNIFKTKNILQLILFQNEIILSCVQFKKNLIDIEISKLKLLKLNNSFI